MKNKEIQEKRMKDYFIQATKEILKSEGIQSLSVRNISDRAGYSYATLYNYFKDVNELIFYCVIDFQNECEVFVSEQTKLMPKGIDRIKAKVLAYISFFVEYPGIFDLFYLTKVGEFGNKQEIINLIGTSLDQICEDDWTYCVNESIIQESGLSVVKSQLRLVTVGLLVMYLNRQIPNLYTEFIRETKSQIDNILKY